MNFFRKLDLRISKPPATISRKEGLPTDEIGPETFAAIGCTKVDCWIETKPETFIGDLIPVDLFPSPLIRAEESDISTLRDDPFAESRFRPFFCAHWTLIGIGDPGLSRDVGVTMVVIVASGDRPLGIVTASILGLSSVDIKFSINFGVAFYYEEDFEIKRSVLEKRKQDKVGRQKSTAGVGRNIVGNYRQAMAEEDSEIESMLSDLDNAILESDVEKDNDFRASNLSKTFRSSSDEEDGFYTTKGNEKNRVEYHESDDSYVDNAYGKLDRIGRGNSAGLKRNIDVEFSKKITKEVSDVFSD
ncbi:hypothetical protein V6N13_068208 [Hibiscus sabdariffa]